ncbi:GspE/PulE family protein [Helicobacter winghamensis]|uniref:General secretion pathway protein GspE n=1 Tax=Helicobacter winghamensis TaxID=157268 RepID=A0A2N3PLD6_9HELI|nr:GspE/PulE family protein [Helicobacter winghamensis]EEO25787.1 type II/IV secretion system protein [Helicobacter winghamensis ATCC BAA-430]PKT75094.1 general secretion pathway protein GspE [Helicobacter winghamensis]PKT79376.1 general secretion pathway protein GspE [Helicobacter winghamensis]PKT79589.1 general secretion pathway protein GspE [Helicobacter winghamensis]PKT82610.1 general secretion pathway protein GspE [Helicobacter winghamensis]
MKLNSAQMRYFGAMILEENKECLRVALLKQESNPHKDTLRSLFKPLNVEFTEIKESKFLEHLEEIKQRETLENLLDKINQEIKFDSKGQGLNSGKSSVQELVHFILQRAVLERASDVHFELDLQNMRIRFRIDGVLIERFCLESWVFAPLSTSIKLLAHLNLTESKLSQDGRFSLNLTDDNNLQKTFDFRVSTLPLVQGESIVLRILDKHKTLMPLESLGFGGQELELIKSLSTLPFGLILITGPTGSGKSTTMYGILNILKGRNLKIITLEDPVEYRLEHINQVAMSKEVEFVSVLRNVLRQDPDVISLGEVRDKESLQLAIQAAFTGHLVFATLHTNDALDSIVRLLDMGVEAHFITQALSGILAQRLLRKLCDCKQKKGEVWTPKGCVKCNYTGYFGRIAIVEVVRASKELESFIKGGIQKAKMLEILDSITPNFTLEQKARELVKLGITDECEVYRVVKNALFS